MRASEASLGDDRPSGSPAGGPIVAIGELLWDVRPGSRTLGGAPFNVLVAARRLGRDVVLVGAVGRDPLGSEARAAAAGLGVDVSHLLEHSSLPTGTARVVLDAAGGPTFEIVRPAAWEGLDLPDRAVRAIAARSPAAFVVGTLAQGAAAVRATTLRLLEACPGAQVLYDVNIRPGAWDAATVAWLLPRATIVQLSAADAEAIAGPLELPWPDEPGLLRALATRARAGTVCLTRGAAGAILLMDGRVVEGRPPAIAVEDTIGAGDAFAAGLLDGVLAGRRPDAVLRRALALGALVASRPGATPEWTLDELAALEA